MRSQFNWTIHGRADISAAPASRPNRYAGVVAANNELIHPVTGRLFHRFMSEFDPERVSRYTYHQEALPRVASHLRVKESHVLLTAGSDAAIQVILTAMAQSTDRLLLQWPNYRGYDCHARLLNLNVERVDTFGLTPEGCEEALALAMAVSSPSVVVITNPSGIDGSHLSVMALGRLASAGRARGHVVLLDEAYIGFSDLDHRSLLETEPNLLLVRSFSKTAGLAGLRIAAVAASEVWPIDYLRAWSPEHPVSILTSAFLCYCLDHEAELTAARDEVVLGRERIRVAANQNLLGWSAPPSAGNFVFLAGPSLEAKMAMLRTFDAHQILVRDVSLFYPKSQAVRVTAGYTRFCDQIVDIIRSFAGQASSLSNAT